MAIIDALRAAALYRTLEISQKEAILSGGGKLAGSLWYILPEAPTEWWPDAQFRVSSQLRLLALTLPKGTTLPGE